MLSTRMQLLCRHGAEATCTASHVRAEATYVNHPSAVPEVDLFDARRGWRKGRHKPDRSRCDGKHRRNVPSLSSWWRAIAHESLSNPQLMHASGYTWISSLVRERYVSVFFQMGTSGEFRRQASSSRSSVDRARVHRMRFPSVVDACAVGVPRPDVRERRRVVVARPSTSTRPADLLSREETPLVDASVSLSNPLSNPGIFLSKSNSIEGCFGFNRGTKGKHHPSLGNGPIRYTGRVPVRHG